MPGDERRRFPRLNVPVLYRAARLLGPHQPARDLSRGGIRVDTDDALVVGTRLEIELFFPSGDSLSVPVRVAWIRESAEAGVRYEAGLEFLTLDPTSREALERCFAAFGEL